MTRELRNKYFPFFMAMFVLTVFFVVFNAVPERGDYTTAVLVFCSVLGWSAIILFSPRVVEKRRLAFHIGAAVLLSLGVLYMPRPFVRVPFWHWFLFGLILFSYFGLYYFIRIQSVVKSRCEEE